VDTVAFVSVLLEAGKNSAGKSRLFYIENHKIFSLDFNTLKSDSLELPDRKVENLWFSGKDLIIASHGKILIADTLLQSFRIHPEHAVLSTQKTNPVYQMTSGYIMLHPDMGIMIFD